MKIRIKVSKDEAQQLVVQEFNKRFPNAELSFELEHQSYSSEFGEINVEVDLFPVSEQLTFVDKEDE